MGVVGVSIDGVCGSVVMLFRKLKFRASSTRTARRRRRDAIG